MSHAAYDPSVRRSNGISDGLIRLSVGLENIDDLTDDIRSAIAGSIGS
jgi:cystathionine beta-lyase/cystathionine gamma-synthase